MRCARFWTFISEFIRIHSMMRFYVGSSAGGSSCFPLTRYLGRVQQFAFCQAQEAARGHSGGGPPHAVLEYLVVQWQMDLTP